MLITLEYQGEGKLKVTSEILDDSDIDDVLDSIAGLLVAYGFQEETVREGFISKGEQYIEEEAIQDKAK